MVSTVKTGRLQQRRDSLKEEMRQLTAINKNLVEAVDRCKDGAIKGYPDRQQIL